VPAVISGRVPVGIKQGHCGAEPAFAVLDDSSSGAVHSEKQHVNFAPDTLLSFVGQRVPKTSGAMG